jgi:hypothetical protein
MAYVPPGITVAQLHTFAERLQHALQTHPTPSLSTVQEAFARAAGYASTHDAHQATLGWDPATGQPRGLPLWPSVSCRRLAEWAAPFRKHWSAQAHPGALAVLAHQWGHASQEALLAVLASSASVRLRPALIQKGFTHDQVTTLQKWLHCPIGLVCVAGPDRTANQALLGQLVRERYAQMKGHCKIYTLDDPPAFLDQPVHTSIWSHVSSPSPQNETAAHFDPIMRSVLQGDPDVLMMGRLYDGGTAGWARKACQSGHQVLAHLDASSPSQALSDLYTHGFLRDAQEEHQPDLRPKVIYQESLPRLCAACAQPFPFLPEDQETLPAPSASATTLSLPQRLCRALVSHGVDLSRVKVKGAGCAACGHSGHQGTVTCVALHQSPHWPSSQAPNDGLPNSSSSATAAHPHALLAHVRHHIACGQVSPWDAFQSLVWSDELGLTIGSPTGHPPFVWTDEQRAQLMAAFQHMAALEEAMQVPPAEASSVMPEPQAPLPPPSPGRSRTP